LGVKKGEGEATVSLAILPLPLGVKNRAAAGPLGHGANGSRIRFDCLRGEGAVEVLCLSCNAGAVYFLTV